MKLYTVKPEREMQDEMQNFIIKERGKHPPWIDGAEWYTTTVMVRSKGGDYLEETTRIIYIKLYIFIKCTNSGAAEKKG